jgi:SAM-dependent methyltransferase
VIKLSTVQKHLWNAAWQRRDADYTNTEITRLFRPEDIVEKNILDIGCGNMRAAEVWKGRSSMTGVDISESALWAAKWWDKRRRLVVGDVSNLPFMSDSFDSVFAIDTLTSMTDGHMNALKEIARVTRNVMVFNLYGLGPLEKTTRGLREQGMYFSVTPCGPMEILSSPDLGDKVFFNVTGLIRTLAGMGLTVETAVGLASNGWGDYGAPYSEQRRKPGSGHDEIVFVRALKRG